MRHCPKERPWPRFPETRARFTVTALSGRDQKLEGLQLAQLERVACELLCNNLEKERRNWGPSDTEDSRKAWCVLVCKLGYRGSLRNR